LIIVLIIIAVFILIGVIFGALISFMVMGKIIKRHMSLWNVVRMLKPTWSLISTTLLKLKKLTDK